MNRYRWALGRPGAWPALILAACGGGRRLAQRISPAAINPADFQADSR